MPCFVCFLNFPCNKKWSKNKILRMPSKFYTIFSEYFWISGANNISGRCTRWAQPTWARQDPQAHPSGLWSPCGPPHLSLDTTSSLTSRKNSPLLSLPCSCSQTRRFRSVCSKLCFQNCFGGLLLAMWLHHFVQLVFVLVLYILNN